MRPAATPFRRAAGFTLVEVLVALFIMAIMAALAFRGIDALIHSKDASLAATDKTLQLNTGISQFEYDMSQLVDSKVLAQPLMCDSSSLRFARRTDAGVQLVVWTRQGGHWQRWASPPVTHFSELQEAWLRSQQWDSVSGSAVTIIEGVTDFQTYLFNNGAWTNCGSTQTGTTTTTDPATGQVTTSVTRVSYTGIRIVLKTAEGELTREKELPAL